MPLWKVQGVKLEPTPTSLLDGGETTAFCRTAPYTMAKPSPTPFPRLLRRVRTARTPETDGLFVHPGPRVGHGNTDVGARHGLSDLCELVFSSIVDTIRLRSVSAAAVRASRRAR